ncbi:hypothetical protein ACA910_021108 [Epithemia clementina (nom. ined.)]
MTFQTTTHSEAARAGGETTVSDLPGLSGGGHNGSSPDRHNHNNQHGHHNNNNIVHNNHHTHHHHHHHHGSSSGKGMPFYRPPRQRQRWSDNQLAPHTEWGDIFFDLFYVAAAYNLGNLLREDPSPRGLLYLVGCFFPIMGIWTSKMFYAARFFVVDDIFHRLYEVATLMPLATSVLHIQTVPILSDLKNNIDMFAFTLSISIGVFLNLLRSAEIIICQHYLQTDGLYPEAYYSSWRDIIWGLPFFCFSLLATIYSAIQYYGNSSNDDRAAADMKYDDNHRVLAAGQSDAATEPGSEDDVAIWLSLFGPSSIVVVLFVYVIFVFNRPTRDNKKYSVPLNIDYTIHRYGEWIMLLLGESVLSLLIVDLSEGYDYYKTFFSGVITVILLEFLHFRSQPHDPDNHALRRSHYAGFVFTTVMWAYSTALIVLGTAYKMFLFEFAYADNMEPHRSLLPLLPWSRNLAGGVTTALRFETEDRQQRIANFFSGSMALVWLCLDVIILSHNGPKKYFERLGNGNVVRAFAVLFIILRVGLIIFIASASQYLTDPTHLSFVGLAGVLCQLVLRVLLSYACPPDANETETEVIERLVHHANVRIRS